jgi:hypothetical protein
MSAVVGLTRPAHSERQHWLTVRDCKKILAVASTLTFTQRLLDVLPLLETDLRVEVSFTVAPHQFGEGIDRFLNRLGCPVLPWDEAVRSTDFDLALAAAWSDIDQLRVPLILLSHGAGHIKRARNWTRTGQESEWDRPPGMFSRDNLTRSGRVVPAVLGLAHRGELAMLARSCPEAVPVARVLGDPAFDRLAASLPQREAYREALGLERGHRLVVAASTWGHSSTFGRLDVLLPRLLGELPRPAYRTAVLTHPNIWAGHGWWQVRGWLSVYRRHGIAVVPPEADYRAVLAAADFVIGDHGSVTSYATLTKAPILLARDPHTEVHNASPAAALARIAPALSPMHPLEEQLIYAAEQYRPEDHAAVAARISSEPGRFNRNTRRLIYRRLGMGEPAVPPVTEPAPLPPPGSLDAWTRGARGETA